MNDSHGVVGDEGAMGNLKDKFIHLTGVCPPIARVMTLHW